MLLIMLSKFAVGQGMEIGLWLEYVLFESDHNVLRNWNTNFADGEDAPLFNPRGWRLNPPPEVANPVSHTKNQNVTIKVRHKVLPEELTYHFYSGDPQNYLSFHDSGFPSGTWHVTTMTSDFPLPNRSGVINYYMVWHALDGIWFLHFENMGNNLIYITWDTPIDQNPTLKRMHWAVTYANNSTTQEQAPDGIWNQLGDNAPPFEPGEKPLEQNATWKLLDGNVSGECDEQALLMVRAMRILGIPAELQLIRASTEGPVTDLESKEINGRIAWLVMDFDMGPGYNWNAFEGCCVTAGKWYAVWPKAKANSAFEMYQLLDFQQYYIYTVRDRPPTMPGWIFDGVAEGPIPKQQN